MQPKRKRKFNKKTKKKSTTNLASSPKPNSSPSKGWFGIKLFDPSLFRVGDRWAGAEWLWVPRIFWAIKLMFVILPFWQTGHLLYLGWQPLQKMWPSGHWNIGEDCGTSQQTLHINSSSSISTEIFLLGFFSAIVFFLYSIPGWIFQRLVLLRQ